MTASGRLESALVLLARILAGAGALSLLAVSPVVVELLAPATGIEGSDAVGSAAGVTVQALLSALFLTYFFRALYWTRTAGTAFWRRHTPPYEDAEIDLNVVCDSAETIDRSRRGFRRWTAVAAVATVLVVAANAIAGSQGPGGLGSVGPFRVGPFVASVFARLPIVGDLSALSEVFPGETTAETVRYLVFAVPMAVALRNLANVLENPFVPVREAEGYLHWGTAYLVLSAVGIATSLLLAVALVVVAIEL